MKTLFKISWPQAASALLAWVAVVALALSSGSVAQANDLDDAFARLVAGRSYLKDFPLLKTRDHMVDDFIGANGETPNRPDLQQAIDRALLIRNTELREPDSFPSGQAPRSVQ